MSSKYVPPGARNRDNTNEPPSQRRKFEHRRNYKPQWEVEENAKQKNEKLEKEKNMEFNDNNFPALGAGQTKVNVWGGPKSFASLANEWREHNEKEETTKQAEDFERKQETSYMYRQNMPLPKFHNVRRFIEPEDEEEQIEKNVVEDEWTTIDRKKIRQEKTFEEKITEREKEEEGADGSVWNSSSHEEHETCWEDKYN